MDIAIDIFVVIADFIIGIFSGDDVKKISKFMKNKY